MVDKILFTATVDAISSIFIFPISNGLKNRDLKYM